jgi:hypothetical protein
MPNVHFGYVHVQDFTEQNHSNIRKSPRILETNLNVLNSKSEFQERLYMKNKNKKILCYSLFNWPDIIEISIMLLRTVPQSNSEKPLTKIVEYMYIQYVEYEYGCVNSM